MRVGKVLCSHRKVPMPQEFFLPVVSVFGIRRIYTQSWGGGVGRQGKEWSEMERAEAKFLVPDWGEIVDYDTGLSYQSASLCNLAVRYDNPMPESATSTSQGLRVGYWLNSGTVPVSSAD